jgi:pimeloyl-ACP methyl ester carboxylesterase
VFPAALALALGGAVLALFLLQRHAVGIVEDNLLRMEQIHLDFSAHGEPLPVPEPGGDGPLVLFFHETAADGGSVEKYLGFLEAPYRVWAPDFEEPPHVAEASGLGIFCVPELEEQARGFLRRARELAGEEPLVVFGVSRGASLAALAITAEPDVTVDGVVLESFFTPQDVLAAKVRRFAPIYLGKRFASLIPDAWLRRFARLGLARVERKLQVCFRETDGAAVELRPPVLFLHGGRDPAAPVDAVRGYVEARGALPGATRLEVFAKARHNACSQAEPERYHQVVQGFLGEATGVAQSATRAEEPGGGGGEA